MRRPLIVAALVAVAIAAAATPASAHNVLVGSQPGAGSSIGTSPTEVRFDFNAPVQFGDDTIVVLGPDGSHWERTQHATVVGDSVSTPIAPLGPAGTYTASYHIISADGHPVTGDITFTLTKAGNGKPIVAASATASQPPAGSSGTVPFWAWLLVAIGVLGGGLYIALRPAGRTGTTQR